MGIDRVFRIKRRAALPLLAAIAVLWSSNALAGPILQGETIGYGYEFPDINSSFVSPADGNYAVGPGVEITNGFCCGFEGTVDFSDTTIYLDFTTEVIYSPGAFNGSHFFDVFFSIDPFTTVGLSTNMVGLDLS